MLKKLILSVLVVMGIIGSIKDWRNWRYEETYRYGHGQVLLPPLKLVRVYQNDLLKIRLKYPSSWQVQETHKIGPIRFSDNLQSSFTVAVARPAKNLPDLVQDEVNRLTTSGTQLSRQWEYANGEKMGFTVITWEKPGWVYQKAMGVNNSRLVVINVQVPQPEWTQLATTFPEIYKNVVLF